MTQRQTSATPAAAHAGAAQATANLREFLAFKLGTEEYAMSGAEMGLGEQTLQ